MVSDKNDTGVGKVKYHLLSKDIDLLFSYHATLLYLNSALKYMSVFIHFVKKF